jgi:hypothetical protein
VADAADQRRVVLFDLLAARAAVAALPPAQVKGDEVLGQRQARREPFQDGDQRLAV